MRTAMAFVCGVLIHAVALADNNCPAGQGSLDGSPCLDSKMVSFLFCFKYTGKGVVEVSQKSSTGKTRGMEVGVTGGGSGLVLKVDGGVTYKTNEIDQAITEATTKIDPQLAGFCKQLSEQSDAKAKGGPVASGPTRVRYLGPMGPLEPGISYNQGDIHDSSAKTPEECSSICYNDDRCIAVTWINSQKRCWVKGSFTGNVGYTKDMVSARKLVAR